ncbi:MULTISPECIES: PAS domain-containing sensor histidine kinase [Haloarcula]|uniref:PAS domain-containing sensor histidine kinase n=1 Tax=Haloarcula TaxID=2237 RepID=UPI0023EDF30E|nr:ATP-binding protein [Halomicroarcula sp. XH51]
MFGLDEAGRVTFATEAFASVLSRRPESVRGATLESLLTPADARRVQTAAEAVRGSGEGATRRCHVDVVDDGEHVPATVELTAAGGARVVGSVHVSSPNERFRHLFDLVHDAVVRFEMDDTVPIVRAVNPAFEETFGYSATEVVGESLNDFIVPAGHASEAADLDERTARGKVNYATVSRETVDGPREFIYRGLPYETDDGRRFGFAIYTDVTESRRRKRQLHVLHRVLRHNLRNELSVVLGMAEHAQRTTADPDVGAALDRILAAADRLASVSEQAREVESALDGVSNRPVDAAALARMVADDYRDDAPVETAIPDTAPVTGSTTLYTALDNLVENAVEHTPPGTSVRIGVDVTGEETVLRVADAGDGIPAIERAVVFDDADITSLQHGSGLGIWLARWVAETAGGDIRYDRSDGWTTVSLGLRTSEADDVFVPDVERSAAGARSAEQ